MRVRVKPAKEETLESLEEMTGVPLTDGAWNALARLSNIHVLEIEVYMRHVLLEFRRNYTAEADQTTHEEYQAQLTTEQIRREAAERELELLKSALEGVKGMGR